MKPGTPLPWKVGRERGRSFWTDGLPEGSIVIVSAGTQFALGVDVAAVPGGGIFDSSRDAAYIAHAANLHPELVDALTRIMHYAEIGASICDVDTSEQPEFVAARAVLTKCKEA